MQPSGFRKPFALSLRPGSIAPGMDAERQPPDLRPLRCPRLDRPQLTVVNRTGRIDVIRAKQERLEPGLARAIPFRAENRPVVADVMPTRLKHADDLRGLLRIRRLLPPKGCSIRHTRHRQLRLDLNLHLQDLAPDVHGRQLHQVRMALRMVAQRMSERQQPRRAIAQIVRAAVQVKGRPQAVRRQHLGLRHVCRIGVVPARREDPRTPLRQFRSPQGSRPRRHLGHELRRHLLLIRREVKRVRPHRHRTAEDNRRPTDQLHRPIVSHLFPSSVASRVRSTRVRSKKRASGPAETVLTRTVHSPGGRSTVPTSDSARS